ncbi:ABC-type multidrug transport system, permease component [Thermococcus kodakarensis KOD1]|uniref:ABC-type multidrug transport system, permease component n=1 Tax=Thermococcus kodakarensis (strain ATCC BAA-918 / JCM 12380 / KOD1) TaxID=69014 RepID=Q5JFS9_THEKO|nr:ABC transporter permease [Thermococcus kodakarensis]WCN28320.1 ABC transporter permease [Thermococcus kodakarensis]WCN30616.1 ABC transporter permease [Thermococcus kodakarensis]BAD84420.1 ABC-type multidrug transport system, permease component [Thermococcus kodakarensis KOD1]
MKARAIISIAYLNITGLLRSPLWIVPQILTPIAMVLILFIFGGKDLALYALVGALVALTVSTSISLSRLVVLLKFIGFQDIFVASPVSPVEYMLGLALSRLLGALPSLLIFMGVLAYLGVLTFSNLAFVVGIIIFSWLLSSLLAFTISTNIKNVVHVDALSSLLSMTLVLIPPVYYPLSRLPAIFQKLALLIPTTYIAELMRIVFGLSNSSASLYATGAAIYTLAFFALVAKNMKWRE